MVVDYNSWSTDELLEECYRRGILKKVVFKDAEEFRGLREK